jgi:lysyl-tRNA synthetase class 2
MDEEALRKVCTTLNISVDPSMGSGKLIDEIFSEKCEKNFIPANFYH